MEKEFKTLSEKRQDRKQVKPVHNTRFTYPEEDVKEFIKKLKERTMGTSKLNPIDKARVCCEIDKLAGDDLIK